MIELEAKGLDDIIRKLEKMQSEIGGIRGVELNPIPRAEGDVSNADLLEYLKLQGHDFITLSASEENRIAQAFDKELQRRIDRDQMEKAAAAGALRSAMNAYMDIVSEKIESQEGAGELTEAYKKQKIEQYGFDKPIGVATGQLRDNLNSKGPGRSMIRIKR